MRSEPCEQVQPSCETDAPPTPYECRARSKLEPLVRRGEPRSRRTHRTPRGHSHRPYPKVCNHPANLAPAQTLQSRLLVHIARSARLQSGVCYQPRSARPRAHCRSGSAQTSGGRALKRAAKTSREEQRPTAGLAPAPRRLLRSQCSRGYSVTVKFIRLTLLASFACAWLRPQSCVELQAVRKINFELLSPLAGKPSRPLNALAHAAATNESFGKSGLGKGVAAAARR